MVETVLSQQRQAADLGILWSEEAEAELGWAGPGRGGPGDGRPMPGLGS